MATETASIKEKFAELVECLRKNDADNAKRLVTNLPELTKYEDDSGRLALHWAATGGCLPFLQLILSTDPALVMKTDEMGWTPLMIASSANRTEVVKFLLSFPRTNVNHRNNNGQSCLHYACSKDNESIAKMLIENGADLNTQDNYGAAPLHRATCTGHEKMVRLLVGNKKIKINVKDKDGNTPLHCACEDDNESLAIFLAKNGADIHMQNKEEKCPLDLAKKAELKKKLLDAEIVA